MVTLTKHSTSSLPFQVEFVSYHKRNGRSNEIRYLKPLNKFTINEEPDFIEDLDLLEYDNLAVRFTATSEDIKQAKLYMDCFDYIDELNNDLELEQDESEFIELNSEISIHRHLDNDVGSPLIPGVYTVKVLVEEEIYYSQILIKPNNLKINEHYEMIKEIESNVKGLARDWIRRNKSLDVLSEYKEIDPTHIDYARMILKHQNLIDYSLNVILKNPYTGLRKNYIEMALVKCKKFDSNSIKLNQIKHSSSIYTRNPLSNEKIYTYDMVENYNNHVNQYLIKVLVEFIKIFDKASLDIEELRKYFNNELNQLRRYNYRKNIGTESRIQNREQQLRNIEEFKNSIEELKSKLLNFRNTSFIRQIKLIGKVNPSQQFIKTPGYNNLYRIFMLIQGKLQNQIEDLYDYNWKSSEILYEYWSMIQIIKYLIKLDYVPITGWIYKKDREDHKVTVPAIPDGTSIEFIKGDTTLKLIFNSMIGKTPKKAEEAHSPYWIRVERNKPDFRLDVFDKGIFQKTIIMDAKYSPADRFWDKKLINTSRKSKVVEQLKLYANSIYRLHTRRENVVEVVIALCPTFIGKTQLIDIDENHSIGVATLKPGVENVEFMRRLEDLILANTP